MLSSVIGHAQPEWRDFTARYFYSILDENGNKISFENNTSYIIMIDSIIYKPPYIPQDSLKPATQQNTYEKGYENHIRLNDFSLAIPQKNFFNEKKQLEIKIIHKKDTMYICQPSGTGSRSTKWSGINAIKARYQITPVPDFTLKFIKGHYYFPDWAKSLIDNLPETSGNVKIKNINQHNFIVSKNIYDSLAFGKFKYNRVSKADEYVVNNFMKGHYTVEERIEPTNFNNSTLPYKNPRWDSKLYPTKDKNCYYGLIDFSMDLNSCYSSKNIFSILNTKENTIELWFPKDNPRLFTSGDFYVDTFNSIIYFPVYIKEEFNFDHSDCYDNTTLKKHIYRSKDEGKTWKADNKTKKLFTKYSFRNFEFLDKDYALGYNKKKIESNGKQTEIVQGTYYLLKKMHVIDSLKTPDNINYNSNYNRYRFTLKNDVALLGGWNYKDNRNYGESYFQPLLIKIDNKWKFQVIEKNYTQPKSNTQGETDVSKEYQNFNLISNRKLEFKNGSESLTLKEDVVEKTSEKGYFVIEKENQIYLINNDEYSGHIYISFNGGTSWYLYPIPLEYRNWNYMFLEINEKNQISHFSNVRGKNGREINKLFHTFKKE